MESRGVVGGFVVGGDHAHLASFIYEHHSSREGLGDIEGSSMVFSEDVVHYLVVGEDFRLGRCQEEGEQHWPQFSAVNDGLGCR